MTGPTTDRSLSAVSRWGVLLLLMVYAALGHFNRIGISVAGSEIFIPKMGISETNMGWVYSAFLIMYTICMIPGGWLIDRIGAGKALMGLGLTMGTMVILTGLTGWVTTTAAGLWLGLIVIRSLAGACSAPLHPAAAHAVAEVMPLRGRATANGMVTAGALIGIACCYPVFGWMMDTLSWQWAFVVSGLVLFGYGLLWSRTAAPVLTACHVRTTADPEQGNRGSAMSLFANRNLWLVTLSYAAYGYFQYLFFYWMEYYFEHVLNEDKVVSRQATAYILLAMGAGMAFGGLSTDIACRWLGTLNGRRSVVMTGMILGSSFALLGVGMTTVWSVAVCLALAMAALGMCEGVFWTSATDLGGPARGFAGAFMNAGGNVGGFISPVLTPMMAKHLGWPGSITVACLICGLGGLIWFLITLPSEAQSDSST